MNLKIVTGELFNPKEILLMKKVCVRYYSWLAVALKSAFWGPLAQAVTDSSLIWTLLILLILSYPTNHLLMREILSYLLSFQTSSENCNGIPEYFQESQSLWKKNRTPKHGCLIPITCLLIFPFLRPVLGICFSFWLFLLSIFEALAVSGCSESDSRRMVVVRALSRAQTVPSMC